MLPRASTVSLYVDPCCPFAWIAYRWLLEVRRYQSIELRLDLMSLPILTEDQDISPKYRRLLERTWAPARVAAAAVHHHGAGVLPRLYAAIARRIFAGDDHYRVIHHDLDRVIAEALADSALPAHLASAAHVTAYDEALRASHNAGMALVGRGVGTPIVHIGGAGFFGPVLTGVPRGADAVRVFGGMRLLAGVPHMFEIKRPVIAGRGFGSQR
jgi:hypothetical protein